jgi:methylmalonyl-CoA/ethylmalonyl-CoA epimerase
MNKIFGMPGIIRIDHVGIAVFDLDSAIDWHIKFLGAKLVYRETSTEQMVEEAILVLKDSTFQLITPVGELSPVTKFLRTRGQGLQQIAFQVTDLEVAVQYAKEQGVNVVFDAPKTGTGGSRINFLHPKDCFGVLIELVEHGDPVSM